MSANGFRMPPDWEAVIGLEVHAELSTESKLLCGCKNSFGSPPNTQCCPVCMGLPGALPVLNGQAVRFATQMGLATGCRINTLSHMNRKHYFYPDLPKAYQTSQKDSPICEDGHIMAPVGGRELRVGIERIHLEEDAGKLFHHRAGVAIDFNRCGVPLIEIVTRPDMRSPDEAKALMEEITHILSYLNISDVKMHQGNVRADVNVSVRRLGDEQLGPRVEMKNLNSFGAVHRAVAHEAARQLELIGAGERIARETRRWDDAGGRSVPMRGKEGAQDYRFLPEPDLLVFEIDENTINSLRAGLPQLPHQRRRQYQQRLGLGGEEATLLARERGRAEYFEAVAATGGAKPATAANWLLGEVARLQNEADFDWEAFSAKATPQSLAALLQMAESDRLSSTAAKAVFQQMLSTGGEPGAIAEELGLLQLSDEAELEDIVRQVIENNPKAAADYRAGKNHALGFLVGKCMGASKGRANPAVVTRLLKQYLPVEQKPD